MKRLFLLSFSTTLLLFSSCSKDEDGGSSVPPTDPCATSGSFTWDYDAYMVSGGFTATSSDQGLTLTHTTDDFNYGGLSIDVDFDDADLGFINAGDFEFEITLTNIDASDADQVDLNLGMSNSAGGSFYLDAEIYDDGTAYLYLAANNGTFGNEVNDRAVLVPVTELTLGARLDGSTLTVYFDLPGTDSDIELVYSQPYPDDAHGMELDFYVRSSSPASDGSFTIASMTLDAESGSVDNIPSESNFACSNFNSSMLAGISADIDNDYE